MLASLYASYKQVTLKYNKKRKKDTRKFWGLDQYLSES
jgi:hypothetical protein